jgi:hypothetical protein
MGVNFKQLADSSLGMEGATTGGDGGFIPVTFLYTASIVDQTFFVADRPYVVKAVRGRVDVAGTGGACTGVVRKVASGTALASGAAVNTGSYNLVGTVNTQQALSLSATSSDLLLAAGDALSFDVTGTATSAVGCITVTLNPA